MAWDIISTPAGPDMSLGAGSESKMTWAHGLIHIWERERAQSMMIKIHKRHGVKVLTKNKKLTFH